MADNAAGGPATPARPLVLTPTDEWLARISDQLDELNDNLTKSATKTASAVRAGAKKGAAQGKKRAEVRGT